MASKSSNKRRHQNDKNASSAHNQSDKAKRPSNYQRLSEVERLKLDPRPIDEHNRSPKIQKMRVKPGQVKLVKQREEKSKQYHINELDAAKQQHSKIISVEEQENEKERDGTMRFGRNSRKAVVVPKKTKPCFVRLEKVREEKTELQERTAVNKKLTGPLKKRPINTPSQVVKNTSSQVKNTPNQVKNTSQAVKNTPSQAAKSTPNQAVKNTPSQLVKKVEQITTVASTRSRRAPKPNPKYSNADIITPKAKPKRVKGLVIAHEIEDTDSTEDFYNALDESSNESEINEREAGEAFVVEESSDFSENEELLKPKRALRITPHATSGSQGPPKRGRPKKILETKRSNQGQHFTQRTTTAQTSQSQQSRKRKLEEISDDDEPPESIIARNKRLNIALYDSNVTKPLSALKNSSKQSSTVGNTRTQSPTAANALANKRLTQGPLQPRAVASVARETLKEKSKSPLPKRSPTAAGKTVESADSANTQDDFETMPTFTIVNIHDIINKKGDSLVQRNSEESIDNISPSTTTNRVNRRKTGHTTILSDKVDPSKLRTQAPRSPFPPRKPISTILNSSLNQGNERKLQTRISLPPPEKKFVPEKPAPRILNSVVGKRTNPVQPILGKLDNDVDLEPIEDVAEKTQMVKENMGANKLPMKPSQPRKLPPEKVFVQRQGNKLIKKITCFETWYVINIPETQEPIVKNHLDIPLITLSNAAKSIKLPSPSWSTKVTLYKLSNQMLGKSTLIPFTGDLSDQSISEEDREKYQPSCVMFRRATQQKSKTRMPYDRAVIFKMKTFFTNIDGKNVRLIGAPSTISSFEEIEVLLELIDELDLMHDFVEQANTI